MPPEQALKWREDLREALSLSREEAIKRYKGKNDLLLYAALDPVKRAVAELYVSLPVEFRPNGTAILFYPQKLSELPADQRALCLEAMRPVLGAWVKKGVEHPEAPQVEGDPIAWISALDPKVHLHVGTLEEQAVVGGYVSMMQPDSGALNSLLSHQFFLQVAGELMPWEQLEARRLAGDTFTKEEEEAFTSAYWRNYHASAPHAAEAEARAQPVNLSEELQQRLASLPLLPSLFAHCTPWQVQEAVGRVSGLNIVSDCFWQPERDQRILYNDPEADRDAPASALQALKAATGRVGARGQLIANFFPDHSYGTAWEWRGAGRFLVFRSADRDVWRAAFLPPDAIRTLNSWVDPFLPEGVDRAPSVTPDWRAVGQLISELTTAQVRWGGWLTYDDPTDFRNACRQALRKWLLYYVASHEGQPHMVRFLGSLSEDQWQQIRTQGLRVGSDIALDTLLDRFRPRPHEQPPYWRTTNDQGEEGMVAMTGTSADIGFRRGDVLLVKGGQRPWGDETQATSELQVLRDGRIATRFLLPAHLTLRPGPTESLALPEAITKEVD